VQNCPVFIHHFPCVSLLAQVKVANKANEIVAIPQLLELLTVQGCIITMDAMGCQKKIVEAIRTRQADYVVTVKGNQPKLSHRLQAAFAAQDRLDAWPEGVIRTEATAHRRHEIRRCCVLPDSHLQDLGWRDCQTPVRLERTTTRAGKVSLQTHYYISSLPPQAAGLLHAIRAHWGIENRCHWILDVVFKEDASRSRLRFAGDNLAVLRKVALNLLHQHPTRGSLKGKRYQASLNEDFLLSVLKSSFKLMR
ncbi:MAG: ISAs1 family transposase, partial [Chloroflexota bacterium]